MKKRGIRLKSPDDIERIRDAGRIIADIFTLLSGMSLVGITTWDIDLFIESQIIKQKGRSAFKTILGYSSCSCISINNEVVHGVPGKKRVIHDGDIVKVDIGVVYKGYFSDACCTFPAGRISQGARRLVDASRMLLQNAIEVMIPGNSIGDIGNTIESFIAPYGFTVVRTFSGHGVGFALHEPPLVPHYGKPGSGIPLEAGMVLAVEPIINEGEGAVETLKDGWTVVTADGSLSAQFEHTIAVTESGPVILTI